MKVYKPGSIKLVLTEDLDRVPIWWMSHLEKREAGLQPVAETEKFLRDIGRKKMKRKFS